MDSRKPSRPRDCSSRSCSQSVIAANDDAPARTARPLTYALSAMIDLPDLFTTSRNGLDSAGLRRINDNGP